MEDGRSGKAEARVIYGKRKSLACVLALRCRAHAPARDEFLDAFGIVQSASIGQSSPSLPSFGWGQRFSSVEVDLMLTCD